MAAIFMGHLWFKNISGEDMRVCVRDCKGRQQCQEVAAGQDSTVHFEAEEDSALIPLPDDNYSNHVTVHVKKDNSIVFDSDVNFRIVTAHHTAMLAMNDPLKAGCFIVEPVGM